MLLALPDIAMRSMARSTEVKNNVKLHNITISCGDYINTGKIFEQEVHDSIKKYNKEHGDVVYYHRVKDPASSFGGGGGNTRFSMKNEYDLILYKYPIFFALELKSNGGTSFSFSRNDKLEKGKDIKDSQIMSLVEAERYHGTVAGLILNFRKYEETYFVRISDFYRFRNETEKKSINREDVLSLNPILIPQTLKKVRYDFDISSLLDYKFDIGVNDL